MPKTTNIAIVDRVFLNGTGAHNIAAHIIRSIARSLFVDMIVLWEGDL